MWFYQIKVLPAYQAVVFKNNTYLKTLETGAHSVFAGMFNNKSFFTILLPKTSQILSIKDISLISYQNFTYKISYSIEYTIVNAKQFCKSFNVVQISQEGYRIPLEDFETKIELRSKSLFMRYGKMVSVKDFATDIDKRFANILQELNDIYNDMGIKIDNLSITDVEMGNVVGNLKNTLSFVTQPLALESSEQEDTQNLIKKLKGDEDEMKEKVVADKKIDSKSLKKEDKKSKKSSPLKAFLF